MVKQLDTLRVNSIAQKIANRLCTAFPEHGFCKADLFASISRLSMYLAKISDPLCAAKYFYKNASIYFNIDYSLANADSFALHECIHYLQEVKDEKGNLIRLGLYDFMSNHGLSLNEAAVQLMTAEALGNHTQNVTYYNLVIPSNSTDYYPLECAIVRQLAYFTGTYPLYYSTLHGNDIFKNTFIAVSNDKVFKQIELNLDTMLKYENELHTYTQLLQSCDENTKMVKKLNASIDTTKKKIENLFIECQNTIISNCFTKELHNIRNMNDIVELKNKLYDFQHFIATNESYTFYNEFYCNMMESLDEKSKQIQEQGSLDFEKVISSDITVITKTKRAFTIFRRILTFLGFIRQKEF